MYSTKITGIPVRRHWFAFLFHDMKMPFVSPKKTHTPPLTFGEDVAVKMSQRTLVLILAALIAATLAWADLKSDARANGNAIASLAADHDVLVRLTVGVEQIQKQIDRQERKSSRSP